MYKYFIIFLTLTLCNNTVHSMDHSKLDFLQSMLPELKKEICKQANIFPDNWLYTQAQFDHNKPITSLALSSDEKFLATASHCTAYLYDRATNEKICYIHHNAPVSSVCFDKTAKQLITHSCTHPQQETRVYTIEDIQKLLRHVKNKKYQRYLTNHNIDTVFFDASEKLLGLETKKIFNNASNTLHIYTIEKDIVTNSYDHKNWALVTSLSPSKTILATGAGGNTARLYDIEHKKYLSNLRHNSPVTAFSFDEAENIIATCSTNEIRFYDIKTQTKINSFTQEDDPISLCFSPTGTFFATGSKKGVARIFTHYTNYTLEQLVLKKALLTWLTLCKPNKTIDSIENLFFDDAFKCVIPYEHALTIWKTFPENMQTAMLATMLHRIKKYGK
jgi:WD40 repeat protein